MFPVLVVPSPLPRRHFGAAAGGVHPIIKRAIAPRRRSGHHAPVVRVSEPTPPSGSGVLPGTAGAASGPDTDRRRRRPAGVPMDDRPPSTGRGRLRGARTPARNGERMSQIEQSAVRNRLLAALPPDDFAALAPALQPVCLDFKQVLYEPGQAIQAVHFVERGMVSMLAP